MAMPVLAENRSFRQAREIAERHAAKNGAHIGHNSEAKHKARGSSSKIITTALAELANEFTD